MADALTAALDRALEEAWLDFSAYVGRRFSEEIRAEKWDWPTEPSPRDIVNTGNLAKSLRIEANGEELRTTYNWTAPYAPAVHDGAVFKATDADGNPRVLPARPWTRPVLRDAATLRRFFELRFQLAMRRQQGAGR